MIIGLATLTPLGNDDAIQNIHCVCCRFWFPCRYVFGDVASPSEEAATLLESIVHNEMQNVVSDNSAM